MAQLSSQFGFIDPKRVLVLRYGDFMGPKATMPLDINPDVGDNTYRLGGCLIVFFTQNARYTIQAVEILSSFNVQESGLGVKFGYVNLTEDDRIVNDLINNENTRVAGANEYNNLVPPYFLLYVKYKVQGFMNFSTFSVGGLYSTINAKVQKGLCLSNIAASVADKVNLMAMGPEQDLGFRASPNGPLKIFNLNTAAGANAYKAQLVQTSKAAANKAALTSNISKEEQVIRANEAQERANLSAPLPGANTETRIAGLTKEPIQPANVA